MHLTIFFYVETENGSGIECVEGHLEDLDHAGETLENWRDFIPKKNRHGDDIDRETVKFKSALIQGDLS